MTVLNLDMQKNCVSQNCANSSKPKRHSSVNIVTRTQKGKNDNNL